MCSGLFWYVLLEWIVLNVNVCGCVVILCCMCCVYCIFGVIK